MSDVRTGNPLPPEPHNVGMVNGGDGLAMLRTTHQMPHSEASYCVQAKGDEGYEVGCDLCGWWRNMIESRLAAYWLLYRHGKDCAR